MGLSRRKYAEHRRGLGLPGGSLQAVQRALERGRIHLEPDDTIDAERADREWAANTDLTKAPASVVAISGPPVVGVVSPPLTAENEGVMPLTEANAAKATWQARTAKLEYLKAAGELVEAKTIRQAVEGMIQRAKTKLLAVPSRAKQTMPELTPIQVAKFEDLIRESLEDLAAGGVG